MTPCWFSVKWRNWCGEILSKLNRRTVGSIYRSRPPCTNLLEDRTNGSFENYRRVCATKLALAEALVALRSELFGDHGAPEFGTD